MDITEKPLSWFMIPVADMVRAVSFYNHVFELNLAAVNYQGIPMAHFAMAEGQTGGALAMDARRAGRNGVVVYLNGGDDLSACLERATEAGGRVLVPKSDIGDGMGFFAHIEDSESNEIGIYSPR
jgi:predicted enzyme related to lactoylglutathione lyase